MPLWIERGIISTILKLCHYTTDQFLPPEPLLWCLTDGCVMSTISSRLPMSCPLGGIFCPGFQPRMNWGAASAAAKDTKKHYHHQHQVIRTSHSNSMAIWGLWYQTSWKGKRIYSLSHFAFLQTWFWFGLVSLAFWSDFQLLMTPDFVRFLQDSAGGRKVALERKNWICITQLFLVQEYWLNLLNSLFIKYIQRM